MEPEVRRKISYLTKRLSTDYDYDAIIRNEDMYKMIVSHDADNFLLTKEDVEVNWSYIKKLHRMWSTGLHPTDVRNVTKDGYDY